MRALIALLASVLTLPSAAAPKPPATQADRILVSKSARTMTLYAKGQELRVYHVALGSGPGGPKHAQGDHETPEGQYTISGRNPHSSYHLSLHISYPNAQDRAHARKYGVPPGADVMIHGLPPRMSWIGEGHRLKNWTDGCIAVTDAEMDEIWKLVPVGTPIEIRH